MVFETGAEDSHRRCRGNVFRQLFQTQAVANDSDDRRAKT